jgi:hypothetical protein
MRLNLAAMSTPAMVSALQNDLQIAIQLEQATLPPYLCAYWSINPNATSSGATAAQNSILTVINEEMMHLAMVCNILNATGGQPSINGSNTNYPVPTYPGPLPGHSKTSNPFVVSLGPVGVSSLQTFMQIELPQYDDPVAPPDGWATIGEFYDEIIALIQGLTDSDFQSTTNGQATDQNTPIPPGNGHILTTNSVATAVAALNEVIVQGEGTKSNSESGPGEAAHYFQFQQVLQSIQSGSWNYRPDVFNMVTNPNLSLADFPTSAITLNNQINTIFSQLLDGLHSAFNSSSPDTNLAGAETSMDQLQTPVQQLMQIPLNNQSGFNCGPVFQYTPSTARVTQLPAPGPRRHPRK